MNLVFLIEGLNHVRDSVIHFNNKNAPIKTR